MLTFFVQQFDCINGDLKVIGITNDLEEAIEIAHGAIDDYLADYLDNAASADALYTRYLDCGVRPFIVSDDPRYDSHTLNTRVFDHLHHAALQCVRLFSTLTGAKYPSSSLEFQV